MTCTPFRIVWGKRSSGPFWFSWRLLPASWFQWWWGRLYKDNHLHKMFLNLVHPWRDGAPGENNWLQIVVQEPRVKTPESTHRVWDEEITENLCLVTLRQKCWSGLHFYLRSWNFCLLHIVCVLCHPGWDVFPSLPCLCYLCLCLCLVSNNKGTSPHRLSFPYFVSS